MILGIVVLGCIVRGSLGGLARRRLVYILRLARLGQEAYYVKDGDDYPCRQRAATDLNLAERGSEPRPPRLPLTGSFAARSRLAGTL